MLFRTLHDPIPPADEDFETPELADAAAALERCERHLQVLAELTEITLKVARSLGELAEVRIETAKKESGMLKPGEDPGAPLNKIAQTIRRTVALEAKLAEDVKSARAGLTADRAQRVAKCKESHRGAVTDAVRRGVEDAFYQASPDADTAEADEGEDTEQLLNDLIDHLDEGDEFRDWLDRPVGETVARLCAALALDPESCLFDGQSWKVRRPQYQSDKARETLWNRWVLPIATSGAGTDGDALRVGRSP